MRSEKARVDYLLKTKIIITTYFYYAADWFGPRDELTCATYEPVYSRSELVVGGEAQLPWFDLMLLAIDS